MPTACMHTRLHGPQGCTSVSYTTSWFGSPEVNKLVVWAGLHTLTTGKYLIGPGNTQHQGCDQPALWSTRTKRRSGRERRRTIEWPQISLQCHFIPPLLCLKYNKDWTAATHRDTQCFPSAVLLQFPSTFCSAPVPTTRLPPPGPGKSHNQHREMWLTLLVKGFNPFGPRAPRVGVYNEVDETRRNSPLYSFLRSFTIYSETLLLFLNTS